MARKFKAQIGFIMFWDKPSISKDDIIEIDTSKVHESWINYWIAMGYLKEIKTVKIRRKKQHESIERY